MVFGMEHLIQEGTCFQTSYKNDHDDDDDDDDDEVSLCQLFKVYASVPRQSLTPSRQWKQ